MYSQNKENITIYGINIIAKFVYVDKNNTVFEINNVCKLNINYNLIKFKKISIFMNYVKKQKKKQTTKQKKKQQENRNA